MAGAAKLRKAALGFRTHSGWASAVLAAGRGDVIEILDRRYVALCDSANPGTKQPFHAAEPMPFAQAESHIALCRKNSGRLAREAVGAALRLCQQKDLRLVGVCVIAASGRPLPDLRAILASHALIHAAEGEFYRDAIVEAAKALGVKTARLKEVDALSLVSQQTDIGQSALIKKLVEMKKTAGKPWGADEKLATLAAWSLLVN